MKNLNRREFLTRMGTGAVSVVAAPLVEKLLSRPSEAAEVSSGIPGTTVEVALNSRCSSHNEGEEFHHWGIYDPNSKPSPSKDKAVMKSTEIPRFTARYLKVQRRGRLSFSVDAEATGLDRDWLMVESGMQQQAAHLACAALGLGTCIYGSMGANGTKLNEKELGIVQMDLEGMKPSYGESYWSSSVPGPEKPWKSGNLPDPDREGKVSLFPGIYSLKTSRTGTEKPSWKVVSQLLWAARGRTPHLVLSKPWGLTIPTWLAMQGFSSVYLADEAGTHLYINWDKEVPTHSVSKRNDHGAEKYGKILGVKSPAYLVILGVNERYARALWEVGYSLENLLVQATSMDISYTARLLNNEERESISALGISNPIAAFAV